MSKEKAEQLINDVIEEKYKENLPISIAVNFGQHRTVLLSGLEDTITVEGSKKYLVSTEKIGGYLYETKIFNYKEGEVNYLIDIYCERYSSESEAIARHYELVKIINENEKYYSKIRNKITQRK